MRLQQGVTLLEMLLVMGIVGLLFVLSVEFYQSYENMYQVQDVKAKVDQLFDAASEWYEANCQSMPTLMSFPPTSTSYYPITNDMTTYMGTGVSYNNPLVDSSVVAGSSLPGFIVQLNPKIMPPPAYVCKSRFCPPPSSVHVIYFDLQVAVKIKNTSNMGTYQSLLGADCISSPTSGASTVTPCSPSATSNGTYWVWERPPFSATLQEMPAFFQLMPILRQFYLQYAAPAYSGTASDNNYYYYSCGG